MAGFREKFFALPKLVQLGLVIFALVFVVYGLPYLVGNVGGFLPHQLAVQPAFAAGQTNVVCTWVGTTSTAWATSTNWSGCTGGTGGSSNSSCTSTTSGTCYWYGINSAAAHQPVITTSITISGLIVGTATGSSTLTLGSGGSLTIQNAGTVQTGYTAGSMIVGSASTTGTVTLSPATNTTCLTTTESAGTTIIAADGTVTGSTSNGGTCTWSDAGANTSTNGGIMNGTFIYSKSGAAGVLSNSGTISGSVSMTLAGSGTAGLTNTGTINLSGGTVTAQTNAQIITCSATEANNNFFNFTSAIATTFEGASSAAGACKFTGTLTYSGTPTTTLTVTTLGQTTTMTSSNTMAFYALTIGTGAGVTLKESTTVANNLSLTAPVSSGNTSLTLNDNTVSLTVTGTTALNEPTGTSQTLLNINAGTATFTGAVTIGGNTLTSGEVSKIVLTTGTVQVGALSFASGSTDTTVANHVIDLSGGAGTFKISGAITRPAVGTITPGTTSTFIYNGTAAQTVQTGLGAGGYANLSILNSNAAAATLSAAVTTSNVTQAITVGDGTLASILANGGFAIAMNTAKAFTVNNNADFQMTTTTNIPTWGDSTKPTFNSSSTVEYNQSTAPTMTTAITYGNLSFKTASNNKTFTLPAAITINGNLTVGGGAGTGLIVTANTNNPTLSIGGTFTVNNSSTFTASASASLSVTGAATVGGGSSGTFTGSGGAINFSSLSVAASGTFTSSTGTVTLSGTGTPLAVNASATFTITSGNTFKYTGNGATILCTGNGGISYYNLQLYPSSSSQQIICSAGSQTLTVTHNLTVGDGTNQGANATTNDAIVSVTGTMTVSDGATFTGSDTAALTAGATTIGGGTSGTFTGSGAAINFPTLSVSAGGTFTSGAGTVTLSGTGTPLAVNATGVFTLTSGNTFDYTGNGATILCQNGGQISYYNLGLKPSSSSAQQMCAASSQTLAVSHDLTVGDGTHAGADATLGTTEPTMNVTGSVTIAAGATLTSTSGTLTVSGNFTNNGTFTHNSATVTISGSGTHTIGGSSSTTFNNFTDTTAGSTLHFANDAGGTTPKYTFAGTVTITGAVGNHITITSDNQPTNQWLVHFNSAQSTITHVTVSYSACDAGTSNVTLDADSTVGTSVGACWVPVVVITVSGTAQQYDETTSVTNGETIKIAVNGTLQGQSTTTSSGAFTISDVVQPNSGDVVTVFIDGVADANEAVAVTKYDGTGNITGIVLYEGNLSLGSDDDQSITAANVGSYDNSVSGDEDVFDEYNGSSFTCDGVGSFTGLCVDGTGQFSNTEKIYIKTGNTFAPGANIQTGKIQVVGALSDSNAITITGTGTGTSRPFYNNGGSLSMSNVDLTYTGDGDTAIEAGTFHSVLLSPVLTATRNYSSVGAITLSSVFNETPTGASTANVMVFTLGGDLAINSAAGMQISNNDGGADDARVNVFNTGSNYAFTAATIGFYGSDSFVANGSTITITGDPNNNGGCGSFNFTPGTSTYIVNSTSAAGICPITYNNLTLAPNGAGGPTYTLGTTSSQTIQVSNNLVLGDGTHAVTVTAATNNPTINLLGNVTLNASVTYTKGSGTTTFKKGGGGTETFTDSTSGQDLGAVQISANTGNTTLSLASNIKLTTLTIDASQTFNQGASFNLTTGGAVTVNGTWTNTGTGGIVLGGNVSNAGTITLNSNAGSQCTDGTDSIVITSSVGGTQRDWTGAGTFTIYNVNATDQKSTTNVVTAYTSTLSNTTWIVANCGATYSGTIYSDDGTTTITSGIAIVIEVNGAGNYTATSNGSGVYSITGVMASAGNVITAFFNTNGGIKGVTVTRAAGSSALSGLNIYQNRVIARSDDGSAVTNTNLDQYDSGQDSDIPFTVTSSNLTVASGTKLIVWTGDTFTPGGTVTTTAASTAANPDGDVLIQSSATLSMGTNALSVGGDYTNSGTLSVSSGQTTTFTATGTGFTITHGTGQFDSMTFNGTGGTWTMQDNDSPTSTITVTAGTLKLGSTTFTVAPGKQITVGASGTLNGGSGTLTLTGTGTSTSRPFINNGIFTQSTGTVEYVGDGATDIETTNITFNNLTLDPTISAARTYTANGSINFGGTVTLNPTASSTTKNLLLTLGGTLQGPSSSSVIIEGTGTGTSSMDTTSGANWNMPIGSLTIGSAGTLIANNSSISLSGSGTPFTNSGTFTPGTSTVIYTGTSATNITATTYNNLSFMPVGTVTYTLGTAASQTITAANLTIGDGTNALTVTAATNNPAIHLIGNLLVKANVTYTKGSGTVLFDTGNVVGGAGDTQTWTDNNTTPQDIGPVEVSQNGSFTILNLGSNVKATSLLIDQFNFFGINGSNTLILTGTGTPLSAFNSFFGNLNPSTGTVQYTGTTATVTAMTYNNLILGGTGTYTMPGTTTTLSGNLTVTSGAHVTKGAGTIVFAVGGAGTQTLTGNANNDDLGAIQVSANSGNSTLNLGSSVKITSATTDASQILSANGSNTLTITGTGTGASRPFINNGIFTQSTGTVEYVGDGATDIETTNITFNNLTLDPTISAARTYTANGSINFGGTVTLNPTASSTTKNLLLTLGGTLQGPSSSSVIIEGTGTGTSSMDTTSGANWNMPIGSLTIGSAGTLIANNSSISLSGSGTPFTNSGTFTPGTSTVIYTGTSATNITAMTYASLSLQPTSGSPTYTLGTASSQTITASNWTLGDGTHAVTVTAATNNPAINLTGNLLINTNVTYTKGTGTLTFKSGGTQTWQDNNQEASNEDLGNVEISANGTNTTVQLQSVISGFPSLASARATTLTIDSGQTFNTGANKFADFYLTGNGTGASKPFTNNGTYTEGSHDAYFYYYGQTATTDVTNAPYGNLIVHANTNSVHYDLPASLDITDTAAAGSGYLDIDQGIGDASVNNSQITIESEIVVSNGSNASFLKGSTSKITLKTCPAGAGSCFEPALFDGGTTPSDFGAVQVSANTANTTACVEGNITLTSLTIDASQAFNLNDAVCENFLGAGSLTLTGNGTPFSNSGTFNASTGTVTYASGATTGTTIANVPYYNLAVNKTANTFTTPSGSINVANNLNITAGTLDLNTNDPTLTVGGGAGTGFSYDRVITIDHTKVPNTDQTSFPVLVSGTYNGTSGTADLRTVANGGKVQNSSGYDIGFYTSNNCSTGKMAWETEKYVASTGVVDYWVNVPTVSHTVDTVFYLCYGNSSITTDQSNKTGTWNSNYKGVFHLPDGTTLSPADSTGINTLTNGGGATATTGQIDGGAAFNGTSQYIDTNTSSPITSLPFTICAWFDGASTASNNGVIAGFGDSGSNNEVDLDVRPLTLNARANGGGVAAADSSNTYSNGTWAYACAVFASTQKSIYLNGVATTVTATVTAPTMNVTYIGDRSYVNGTPHGNYFVGSADEVEFSNVALSSDWINTAYNNENSPSTFYSVGSENSPTGATGGTLTINGTLSASNTSNLVIDGNFSNSGTFTSNSGTVVFADNAQTSTVSGATTFHNVTVSTSNKTVSFTNGVTYTIDGALTTAGTATNNVVLNSTTPGSQWTIKLTGSDTMSYTSIQDSACDGASITINLITSTGIISLGHNGMCWEFTASQKSVGGIDNGSSGSLGFTGGGTNEGGSGSQGGGSGSGGGLLPQVFTASDGTALTTYDSDWTILSGGSAFAISSNALKSNQASQYTMAQWTAGSFNNNQYAQATLTTTFGGGIIGVAVRTQNGANSGYTAVEQGTNNVEIDRIDAGVYTQLYTGTAFSNGDVLRLEISGTTLTLKQNGTVVTTVTDSTYSSGRPGVAGYGVNSGNLIDNWYADSIDSQGGSGGGGGGGTP